jgi:hypothetical protein
MGYTYEETKVDCYDKHDNKIIGLQCEGLHESIKDPYANILIVSLGVLFLGFIGMGISNNFD